MPQLAPKALEPKEQERFLEAAEHCRRVKDTAVTLLLFHSGIRIGECAALNIEDVPVNLKKGKVIVRSGKSDRYREVPLNKKVREALIFWLAKRRQKFGELSNDEPLFLNPQGRRMSATSLDRIVRKIGEAVGLDLSAQILRHNSGYRIMPSKSQVWWRVAVPVGRTRFVMIEITRHFLSSTNCLKMLEADRLV